MSPRDAVRRDDMTALRRPSEVDSDVYEAVKLL
jgi:hypothetical protein